MTDRQSSVVLGVSASLRNARFGVGSEAFCSELRALDTIDDLRSYLNDQTKVRLDDFIQAGRENNLPFDEIHDALGKLRGDRGLSNSEAALAAGLWGALQEGQDIDHLPLAPHFPPTGRVRNAEGLRKKLLQADGLLLSGPVYFGDRGSLAQALVDFINADPALQAHLKDRVYGGLAIGAKRNGGQETTLIYQIADMVNLNMLAVGNDSETTSQYGGTAVAGDVGTFASDEYGINTCIGTGRRVARVAKLVRQAKGQSLRDRLKLDIWLLQDADDGRGLAIYQRWCDAVTAAHPEVEVRLRDFTSEDVTRCIACDVCPVEVGPREEYRCIITSKRDLFARQHSDLLDSDAILLAAYSPGHGVPIRSVYQSFIERTRYLRRDNYLIGDRLTAPFVIGEPAANQNLQIRMLTSMVRHHAVLHRPIQGWEFDGKLLNFDEMVSGAESFIRNAADVLVGRLIEGGRDDIVYNPLGYVVSMEKTRRDLESGRIQSSIRENLDDDAKRNSARIA